MTTTKQFGTVGVLPSATSPAGNIALLFGYDYTRAGGEPHKAALLPWQEARKMAQHIMSLTEPHAVAEIARIQAQPSQLSTVLKKKGKPDDTNRPKPAPPGKELVKKDEPAHRPRERHRGRTK